MVTYFLNIWITAVRIYFALPGTIRRTLIRGNYDQEIYLLVECLLIYNSWSVFFLWFGIKLVCPIPGFKVMVLFNNSHIWFDFLLVKSTTARRSSIERRRVFFCWLFGVRWMQSSFWFDFLLVKETKSPFQSGSLKMPRPLQKQWKKQDLMLFLSRSIFRQWGQFFN